MVTKFECENCKNNDPRRTRVYDGMLGYEAIYCTVCGAYFDHEAFHLPDKSSFEYISKLEQRKLLQQLIDAAPQFVLFTNQYGKDMFIADPDKIDMPVTDTISEALAFSVGYDEPAMKLHYYRYTTGYDLEVKHLSNKL